MSTTFQHLPIDDNGIVQGVWRLVHASPTFDRELGGVRFCDGCALTPICGQRLKLIIAEYGGQLFLEPWTGDLPRDFMLPDAVAFMAPDALLGRLPRAPWREKIFDALMPLTEELIKHAESEGVDAESHIAQFNAMIVAVPSLDAHRATEMRARLEGFIGELRGETYVEIPKALEACIEQLDQIIAASPPTEPAPSEPSRKLAEPAQPAQPTEPTAPIAALEAGPAIPPEPTASTGEATTPIAPPPPTEPAPSEPAKASKRDVRARDRR